MRLLPAASRIATAWKNGGGTTREVAAFPPGAGLDDFDWRVSMATVESGGSFSSFPNVDRILVVVRGAMELSTLTRESAVLTAGSGPFAFPGDMKVEARVIDGPVEDVNVMTRRGHYKGSVMRVRLNAGAERPITLSHLSILLCEAGEIDLLAGEEPCRLAPHDAVLFDETGDAEWIAVAQTDAVLLAIRIVDAKSGVNTRF